MGYYSCFELTSLGGTPKDDEEIVKYLNEHKEESFAENMLYALEYAGGYGEPCKWYDMKEDMIKLTTIFPGMLFQIDRVGEESVDIEQAYFRSGLSYSNKARITFDEFDEKLLK